MLNDNDLNRYARQVIIPNYGEDGQEKLLKTKCLIVGRKRNPDKIHGNSPGPKCECCSETEMYKIYSRDIGKK